MKKEQDEKNFFSDYKDQIKEALEDLKTAGRRHKQIPNILTMLRLTAPFIIIPAAIIGNVPFILWSTAAFGITDLADGFIARNWNLTSKLGKDLDAFADKMFAGTLLLAAAVTNPLLYLNVGLEMAIAGININQKVKGKEAASTMMGKIKTFALFPLAGVSILSSVFSESIIATLAVITTVSQFLTIKSYLKKYNKSNNEEVATKENILKIEEPKNDELTNDKEKKLSKEQIIKTELQPDIRIRKLQEMKTVLLNSKPIPQENHDSTTNEKGQNKLLQKNRFM